MLFRRRRTQQVTGPSGPVRSGLESVLLLEDRVAASLSVQVAVLGPAAGFLPDGTRSWSDGLSATAYALGRAATGTRSAAILDSDGLRNAGSTVADAVRSRIPLVIHLVARDDWSAALSAGADGAVVLVPRDIRDAAALAVAAHRIAEQVLLPVVCVHDAAHVAYATADCPEPSDDDLDALLPDRIAAPGFQEILFGGERPAVPVWIDPDRPMGLGARMAGTDDLAAGAGRALFLDADMGDRIDRSLELVADALKRPIRGVEVQGSGRETAWLATAGPLAAVAMTPSDGGRHPARVFACTRLVPFPAGRIVDEAHAVPGAVVISARPGMLSDAVRSAVRSAGAGSATLGLFAGGSALPSASDLAALADRLRREPLSDRLFVGARRSQDRPGLPEAERLEQRLRAGNPAIEHVLVEAPPAESAGPVLVACGPLLADLAGHELARAVTTVSGVPVRTTVIRASDQDPVSGLVSGDHAVGPVPARARVVVAESAVLLDGMGLETLLEQGGSVLVPDPERVSAEIAGRIRQADAGLFGLSATGDVTNPLDTPVRLLHASLRLRGDTEHEAAAVTRSVISSLHDAAVLSDTRADFMLSQLAEVTPDGPVAIEGDRRDPQPPSVLRADPDAAPDISDPVRFWRLFGFAHAAGRMAELAPDPIRAVGALPARSGWPPHGSGHPHAIPSLVPERCTGCGSCWLSCPESALMPAAPSFQAILDTALDLFGDAGGETQHLGRVTKPLVQECYKVFRGDALHQFRTIREIVSESLTRVMDRAKLEEGRRSDLQAELDALSNHLPALAPARTGAWFDAAESEQKGSGRPLLLALDPDRCTACGLCVVVCGDEALEAVPSNPGRLEAERLGAAFTAALPPLPDDVLRTATAVEPASWSAKSRAARAAAGGDGAPMRRASIRAMAVAAEALRGPAMDRHAARIRAARKALEEAIQSVMAGSVSVNDFEAFSRRLAGLGNEVTPESLVTGGDSRVNVDTARLRVLTKTRNALADLETRISRGDGRSSLVMVFDGRDRPTWPMNPYGFPWLRVAAGAGPGAVRALCDALTERVLDEVALVRFGEALARDVADGTEPDPVTSDDLDPDEAKAIPIPVLVTDRLSEGIVALLDDTRPVRILILQADPTAVDAGDPAIAAAALGSACVVQGSLADARHLAGGLETLLATDAPALVSLLAPDGPAEQALARMQTAAACRVFPPFVFRPRGESLPGGSVDLAGNPAPDADWSADPAVGATPLHWMAADPAERAAWRFVPRGEAPPDAVDAPGLLDGSESATDCTPVVTRADGRIAVVNAAHMARAARRLRAWRRLRVLAATYGHPVPDPSSPVEQNSAPETLAPSAATATPAAAPADVHARLTARLLELSGFAPGQQRALESLRSLARESAEEAE